MRVHNHPALLSGLKKLRSHGDLLETYSPSVKPSGFFYFDSVGLVRPEITHYRKRLSERYDPPAKAKVLFLVPQTRNKPFHKAPEFKKIRQLLRKLGEPSRHSSCLRLLLPPLVWCRWSLTRFTRLANMKMLCRLTWKPSITLQAKPPSTLHARVIMVLFC